MRGILVLPVDRQNPPALAVVEKLNAVDSAHEWFRIVRVVARLVGAPHVRDLTKLLNTTRDFLFVESIFLENRVSSRDEAFDIQDVRRKIDINLTRLYRCRNQSRTRNEQRTHPIPIALLRGRARDHVVGYTDNS